MQKTEIHITVELDRSIEQFKSDCSTLGVKPIVIDTMVGEPEQVMTSSKAETDYRKEMKRIKHGLTLMGYDIVRVKVEKMPDDQKDPSFLYYESHVRIKLQKGSDKTELFDICERHGFHPSRNLFKTDELFDYQMATYRSKSSFERFVSAVFDFTVDLDKAGFVHDKVECEECVYDTNEELDNNWLYGNKAKMEI